MTTNIQPMQTAPAAQAQQLSLLTAFIQYVHRSDKTTKTYITNLRQFVAWMHYAGIQQPGAGTFIGFSKWLESEHDAIELDPTAPEGFAYRLDRSGNRQRLTFAQATVKLYLQSVKQFFAWAISEGYYPESLAKELRTLRTQPISKRHKKDSLNAQEVQAIERQIISDADQRNAAAAAALKDVPGRIQRSTEQGKRLFAIYLLAVNAGLRTIEISRARIRDLQLKNGNATLYVFGKCHTEADTPKAIAPAVYEAIRDYLDSRSDSPTGNSPLFVATGNRSGGKALDPTTISKMIKKAMRSAGFDSDRLTAHSLRHTAGQAVMEITGDNIYQTQQYMRHSNPATTEIYLDTEHAEQDRILAQRLFEHYHGAHTTESAAEKVKSAMQTMTPAQLEQLAAIAAAMNAR